MEDENKEWEEEAEEKVMVSGDECDPHFNRYRFRFSFYFGFIFQVLQNIFAKY